MSEENVEIVRRLYARWKDEAFQDDEAYDMLDPEIEWDVSLREVWESGRIEPLEFISAGDEVVVPVRLDFVSRTDHQTLTAKAAHVWTLRDGKVIRHCVFQTKAEALEAAGLQE